MKKTSYLALFILLFFACCKKERQDSVINKNKLLRNTETLDDFNDQYFVSQSIAENIASHLDIAKLDSNVIDTTKQNVVSHTRILYSSKYQVPNLYIIELNNYSQFVIIPADYRFNPILAHSAGNAFLQQDVSDDANTPISYGLYAILDSYIGYVDELRDNFTIDYTFNQDWNWLPVPIKQPSDPNNPGGTGGTGTGNSGGSNATYINSLMNSKWGQACSFNGSMPICPTGANCGHMLVGCVPIAMGQIMYYNQWPTSYSWTNMNPVLGTSESNLLLSNICSSTNTQFGCDASATTSDNSVILGVFKNAYGYNYGYVGNYYQSISGIIHSLTYHHPVFASGAEEVHHTFLGINLRTSYANGHAWVIDGVNDYTNYYGRNINFYCNWGWYGVSNGWYYLTHLSPTGTSLNFTGRLEVIYDLSH